ncbi:MAG: hypothetical protein R3F11_27870 [Verrucomicrobiales bacterium]
MRYDAGGATLRMKSDPTLVLEWLADRGVPADQRGNDDDPDHDGVENCLEALFALDPMSPDRPDIVPGTAWVDGKRYGTVTLTTNEQTIAEIRLLLHGIRRPAGVGPRHRPDLRPAADQRRRSAAPTAARRPPMNCPPASSAHAARR